MSESDLPRRKRRQPVRAPGPPSDADEGPSLRPRDWHPADMDDAPAPRRDWHPADVDDEDPASEPAVAAPRPEGGRPPLTAEDLRAAVQERHRYYIRTWKKMLKRCRRFSRMIITPSWNWSAFLFSVLWLYYRRLTFTAFLLSIGHWGTVALGMERGWHWLYLNLIPPLLLGIFGNGYYFFVISRRVRRAYRILEKPPLAREYLVRRSGTSLGNAFIGLLFLAVMDGLVIAALMAASVLIVPSGGS